MRSRSLAAVAVWTALATVGCDGSGTGDPPGEAPAVTVDTLGSGQVVVTNQESGWADDEAWRLERTVRISPSADVEGGPFDRVVDIAPTRDGRILVLDAGSAEVRAFSALGVPLGILVGPRDSTAPLVSPYAMLVDPRGRVWVGDAARRTYATFESDGRFVGAMPSPLLRGQLEGQMRIVGARLFDFGFLMSSGRVRSPTDSMTALGPGVVAFALDRALATSDTLAFATEAGGRSVPFAPRPVAAVGPRGEIWVGRGDRPVIHLLDLRGDTLRTVTWTDETIPLDSADVALLQGWLVNQSDENATLEPLPLPSVYPHFERIVPAEDGSLWLYRRTSATEGRFEILDVDGHHAGSIATDLAAGVGGVHPFIDRDRVIGIVLDSTGRPAVVVDRIVRPQNPPGETR
jgi:hypothetical protein